MQSFYCAGLALQALQLSQSRLSAWAMSPDGAQEGLVLLVMLLSSLLHLWPWAWSLLVHIWPDPAVAAAFAVSTLVALAMSSGLQVCLTQQMPAQSTYSHLMHCCVVPGTPPLPLHVH